MNKNRKEILTSYIGTVEQFFYNLFYEDAQKESLYSVDVRGTEDTYTVLGYSRRLNSNAELFERTLDKFNSSLTQLHRVIVESKPTSQLFLEWAKENDKNAAFYIRFCRHIRKQDYDKAVKMLEQKFIQSGSC